MPTRGSRSRSASIAKTGRHVSINSPLGGTLTIGQNFRTGSNVVVLSGAKVNAVIGDDVTIDSGAVVVQTSIGSDSTVGEGAYLANSDIPCPHRDPAQGDLCEQQVHGIRDVVS